ncbi:hypothetical protein [Candidatus Solirubrobacter pratensis]|uniref:hypothetical protein n=1 Tax=Candidatus Solirubrobacter pratensis TaxID=1298857 RepID=UPI0012DD1AC2|nr:hypothetical protein [Candidatus Solirubrobacter pratensis]
MRRPSPAMLVALLALFLALGGPAQARRLINGGDIKKGTIRSTQIKDRTIQMRDINQTVRRQLQQTPTSSISEPMLTNGAVGSNKLANGAVTGIKIAGGAVTTGSIADGSINGAKIADGSLTAADTARFAGRFRITQNDLGTIGPQACWRGEPQGLAPERAGADISADALLVTPLGATWDDSLMLTARTSGAATQPSRFVLDICNPTGEAITPSPSGLSFSYVVIDVP